MDTFWIIALIVFAALGAPLFTIFGAAAMLLFHGLPDTSITGTANDVFSQKFADSPLLVTIPLFTFAGYIMAESGTPARLVRLSRAWLGWMPGGLAIVCLVASAFFTTFTGGSGITIVAIGGLLYPALLSDRYDEKFALGLVTTGGSLGLLFPPSVPMIIYGVVGGIMIEKLFIAGMIPGLISVIALTVYATIVGKRRVTPRQSFAWKEAFAALWATKWELMLPLVLIGGMYVGFMRIHEASAFAAIYTLIIEVLIYRDVKFGADLTRIIRESMTLVGAILAILATATGFTSFLIQARVPMQILDAMSGLITSQVVFLIALNIFLLIVGMLMDIFSAIVVVVPLIMPIAEQFGVDPYHLGVVFLLNLEIGYLTPPVGLNLFISSFRFEKPITTLYRSVVPFIGLLSVVVLIVTYIPALSLWLPNQVLGDQKEVNLHGGDGIDQLLEEGGAGGDVDVNDLDLDDFAVDAADGVKFDELDLEAVGAAPADGADGAGVAGDLTIEDLMKDLEGTVQPKGGATDAAKPPAAGN